MDNKQRLLDLISKREEMCSKPLNYESVYEWLEELHYLFSQINISSSIVSKTLIAIEQLLFFNNDKRLLSEKIVLIKAKLTVFEKYESEKLRNN